MYEKQKCNYIIHIMIGIQYHHIVIMTQNIHVINIHMDHQGWPLMMKMRRVIIIVTTLIITTIAMIVTVIHHHHQKKKVVLLVIQIGIWILILKQRKKQEMDEGVLRGCLNQNPSQNQNQKVKQKLIFEVEDIPDRHERIQVLLFLVEQE